MDAILDAVLDTLLPDRLAGYFHHRSGGALINVDVALSRGLRVFDAAAGRLGGCLYAPGAAGNVATGSLLAHLTGQGWETGPDAAVGDAAEAMARDANGSGRVRYGATRRAAGRS